jgi:hypothetical protein
MKQASVFFLILLSVVSCAPVPAPQSLPTTTFTAAVSTSTWTGIPPTETSTAEIPTATSTPVTCDPLAVDYCITDGHFIFQRPIHPPANTSVDVTYRYASTANGTRDPHHGVEFLNKYGTPVYAAGDGTVVFAGPDTKAIYSLWTNYYGNVIVIQHYDEMFTLYAHLSTVLVEAGKTVRAGEQIGAVGQTGVAIGSHLHFEVRRGNIEDYFSTQNPELWLAPNLDEQDQPFGALEIAARNHDGTLAKGIEFTLQYLYDANRGSTNIYYGVSYSADMLNGDENAAFGDLPAGKYRMVLQYNGQRFERRVQVESGRLTQVVFVASQ